MVDAPVEREEGFGVPLVPHLFRLGIGQSPDMDIEFCAGWKVHRFLSRNVSPMVRPLDRDAHLQREEQGEPTHHVWTDHAHSLGVDTQTDIAIEVRLEISRKPM